MFRPVRLLGTFLIQTIPTPLLNHEKRGGPFFLADGILELNFQTGNMFFHMLRKTQEVQTLAHTPVYTLSVPVSCDIWSQAVMTETIWAANCKCLPRKVCSLCP